MSSYLSSCIKRKAIVIFTAGFLLILSVVVIASFSYQASLQGYKHELSIEAPILSKQLAVALQIQAATSDWRQAVLTENTDDMEQRIASVLVKPLKQYQNQLKQALIRDTEIQVLIGQIQQDTAAPISNIDVRKAVAKIDAFEKHWLALLANNDKQLNRHFAQSKQALDANTSQFRWFLIVMVLVVTFSVFAGMILIVNKKIVRPIRTATRYARAIASGDFT